VPLQTEPFADEHLGGAASLLADRHRRHRQAEPLLSPRYEDHAAAGEEIEALWRSEGASGAVGLRDGRMTGFVLGVRKAADVWGANVWVDSAGHAASDAEDLRDVYAAAAEGWVEEGRTRHYVLVPATDLALVDAWFRLCFGQQQSHGVREAEPAAYSIPEGFEIRPPDLADVEQLIDVDLALPRHQQLAPVFSTLSLPLRAESRAEWESTLAEDDEHILIGYHGGRPVALWALMDFDGSPHFTGLMRIEAASYLSFAVTLPEFRGSGIGVALTEASLEWAAERGDPAVVTDWRVTNLRASRFWPRRGFRPTFLRLYRSIP
jgi:GNAT superfamily N-acetyltransferase